MPIGTEMHIAFFNEAANEHPNRQLKLVSVGAFKPINLTHLNQLDPIRFFFWQHLEPLNIALFDKKHSCLKGQSETCTISKLFITTLLTLLLHNSCKIVSKTCPRNLFSQRPNRSI